jgi:hypothetical protein
MNVCVQWARTHVLYLLYVYVRSHYVSDGDPGVTVTLASTYSM